MSYNYKGTKITGTSTSGKVFKKSGVANAKKNQTYFNTATGHVYTCSDAGKPKNAKWKYTRTDICAKPKLAVTKLGAPERTTGHTMKATWKVPSGLTNVKNGKRAQGLDITWYLGIAGKDPKKVSHTGNERLTTSSINLDNVTIGRTTYKRTSFYPLTNKKLAYVTVNVRPDNSKGNGPIAKNTRKFTAPKAPTISALTLDPANGQVSCTITTDAGAGYQERYDTRYVMTVINTHTGEETTAYDTSSTATSIPLVYDATGYQAINYGEYILVKVEAWARGYAGDSGHVTKQHYISFPNIPSIIDNDVSAKDATGKCTLTISTNETTEHPVDVVTLEYMADVAYEHASDIPGGASWESSGIVDDGQCTALTIPVADLIPSRGLYTWVRLRSWHDNEAVLYRYSEFLRLDKLTTPAATAADDDIIIVSAVAGGDGDTAVVTLAWNKDGDDDSTGTELTWSDEEDCWRSTEDPKKYEFTWSDGPITVGADTYNDSAVISIKGLEDATKYYIRARRYLEGDPTTYSDYSNTATCLTSELPESIVATCNRYVPTGDSLAVYWTFAGNGIQNEWQIVQDVWYELSTDDTVNVDKAYFELVGANYVRVTPDGTEDPTAEGWYEQCGGAVIATGQDSIGSTQISAERLATFAVNGSVSFNVQASTGSGFVVSESIEVSILDAPMLAVTASSTLTAQPVTFDATVSTLCDLVVIVTSQGASGQFPTGLLRQTSGDTIHSDVYVPEWSWDSVNDVWRATITLPGGLDFWDLGNYTLSVTAVDRATGLKSGEIQHNFSIAWAHQAPDPFDYVTLTPIDTVDDNDIHHQAVQIYLTPPATSATTDVYDIYRLTGDGAHLIGESFPLTFVAMDEYAPFGDDLTLYYRIAVRTVDGDVEFSDIEYVQDGSKIRFDWSAGTLELPYNLSVGDKYKKAMTTREHMDGGIDGYWNQNITRTASLKSDVIQLTMQDEIDAARQLAHYAGPVFVRTPDGSAYEADVQVSDLSSDGTLTSIAIDATEIDLTQEFILPTPYDLGSDGSV